LEPQRLLSATTPNLVLRFNLSSIGGSIVNIILRSNIAW